MARGPEAPPPGVMLRSGAGQERRRGAKAPPWDDGESPGGHDRPRFLTYDAAADGQGDAATGGGPQWSRSV